MGSGFTLHSSQSNVATKSKKRQLLARFARHGGSSFTLNNSQNHVVTKSKKALASSSLRSRFVVINENLL
jgi:hypothetical protein